MSWFNLGKKYSCRGMFLVILGKKIMAAAAGAAQMGSADYLPLALFSLARLETKEILLVIASKSVIILR